MKRKVFVVPHSHWDREWYFSQEDSNLVLSQNMSFLLDYLDKHEEFPAYVFDGQYSVMHDFLDKYPEKRPLVKKLVTAGRLKIGPWTTQCDTLLNQTESVIRNLLLGKTGSEALGGAMEIGYLPDVFGQNAYLPSIFKRFGFRYSILQRGLYTEQLKDGLNFIWQAPNGEGILTSNIFFGYGPGKFLASGTDYIEKSLLPILDKLAQMTPNNEALLLPAGGDQVLIRTQFPQVISELNARDLPYEFVLSGYEEFMASLPVARGSLISGELLACQKSRIHNTIRSQRVDLKLLNSQVEEKIYQQLEPLAVLAASLGADYPQSWINSCLRDLFDAHAHDSLGGCNSDETNQAIKNRLLKIERIVDGQINILKKQIARGIGEKMVVAFQLLPKPASKNLTFVLFSREKNVRLKGLVQTLLKQDYISGGKKIVTTVKGDEEAAIPGYYRSEILAKVNFDGFGYKAFTLENQESEKLVEVPENEISNEFYSIKLEEGRLSLVRKSDRAVKSDWLSFEDTQDGGDSYDYSPVLGDEPQIAALFTLQTVKKSYLVSELSFSCRLKGQEILTTLRLEAASGLIKIEHSLDNQLKDHRLRVRFHGENTEGISYGDQGYSLQKRVNVNPHLATWQEEGFVECPQAIYPLERFVMVPESNGAVMLYTKGLKEYEATDQLLNLTLFRSVGLLGRDNLAWRPGRASGINNKVVETPDAQLQGNLSFAYAFQWRDSLDTKAAYQGAEEFAAHQLTYQLQELNSFEERLERFELPQPEQLHNLPVELNLLHLPDNVFVSSFKKAENADYFVLRLFNPQDKEIFLPHSFETLSLDEKEEGSAVSIKSKDFVTVKWNSKNEK